MGGHSERSQGPEPGVQGSAFARPGAALSTGCVALERRLSPSAPASGRPLLRVGTDRAWWRLENGGRGRLPGQRVGEYRALEGGGVGQGTEYFSPAGPGGRRQPRSVYSWVRPQEVLPGGAQGVRARGSH